MNGIDDGSDNLLERAEYEEMRDDLLGDPEQLEEEVGFGEIMINQVIVVVIVVMLVIEKVVNQVRMVVMVVMQVVGKMVK